MAKPSKHQLYLRDLGALLKEYAREAVAEKRAQGDEKDEIYHAGETVAYSRVIALMQQQAQAFGISPDELGLDDIDVEKDLLPETKQPAFPQEAA